MFLFGKSAIFLIACLLAQPLNATASGSVSELPFTVEEFVERFNLATQKLEVTLQIVIGVFQENDHGETLAVSLQNKGLGRQFLIQVNATKSNRAIRNMAYMGKCKDYSDETILALLSELTAFIMAIENPVMPVKMRGQRLKEIGFAQALQGENVTTRKKGIEYALSGDLRKLSGLILVEVRSN